jgi:hypothetical protein
MELVLHFRSYIADPYWPAREQLVTIEKQSGINRARSQDTRDKALRGYLEKIGLTIQDYEKLQALAGRPWYRKDNDDPKSPIIIPRHQLAGAMVQGASSAPAGARFNQDQLRSLLDIRDFETDKIGEDRVFERYVLPKDGKGNVLSNQRRLERHPVIEDFEAIGEINFDGHDVKEKSLMDLIRYIGKYVGVGASRKMGYGRFAINGQ